ncbi:MAG: flagellar biosynthetic protein FliR [Deltaproteobacteria bacterium]|nr:flagellar biosynthetic protein FliR [Deltaproteobacteria bacterium]
MSPAVLRDLLFWAPLLWIVPLFGGRHLPAPARLALALGLALLADPALPPPAPLELGLAFAAGLTAGLTLHLPFALLRGVGGVAAQSRGTPSQWSGTSTGGERAPPLALALELALLVGAGSAGLDHRVLRVAARLLASGGSMRHLPILDLADLQQLGLLFFGALVALALPFLLASLLLDLALGLVGRFLPALPLFFLGQPLKSLGVALVAALSVGELLPAVAEVLERLEPLLLGSGR